MPNPYRQLKEIVRTHAIDPEGLVHALMIAIYSQSCEDCNHTFHSNEFITSFERNVEETLRSQELLNRKAS